MKKKYIQPSAMIHALRPSRMCEGSLGNPNNDQMGSNETDYSKEENEDINFGW